jgi:hypothetical protein
MVSLVSQYHIAMICADKADALGELAHRTHDNVGQAVSDPMELQY